MVTLYRFHPEGFRERVGGFSKVEEEKGVVRVNSKKVGNKGLRIEMDPLVIG